jgi:hypothetical protein
LAYYPREKYKHLYIGIVKMFENVVENYTLASELRGALVARMHDIHIMLRLGYRSISNSPGYTISFSYLTFIGYEYNATSHSSLDREPG